MCNLIMEIRKMQDGNFAVKNVLVRADFNVAVENGKVGERFKLEACKQTVIELLKAGAKVAIISHLGRPEGKIDLKYSLLPIKKELENILEKKVLFVDDCIGEKVKNGLAKISQEEVLLLENVRFYEGEEKNDQEFAQKLAENFDFFVNDAFSVCHRDQASVTGVAKILPSYAGFWLQKEIENMNKALHEPMHPATAIIGGAKIETKLPLIKVFEKTYDHILVGGKIANEALDQGMKFSAKVILPVDFAQDRLDVGPMTSERFKQIISNSKMIVWNGPMGKFEQAPYDQGTRKILDAVIESDAYSLIGGGESVQMIEQQNMMHAISFVSTGGGAMLEYLSGNILPGIEVLKF